MSRLPETEAPQWNLNTGRCPQCRSSSHVVKNGTYQIQGRKAQKFICRKCDLVFCDRIGSSFYKLRTNERLIQRVYRDKWRSPFTYFERHHQLKRETLKSWFRKAGPSSPWTSLDPSAKPTRFNLSEKKFYEHQLGTSSLTSNDVLDSRATQQIEAYTERFKTQLRDGKLEPLKIMEEWIRSYVNTLIISREGTPLQSNVFELNNHFLEREFRGSDFSNPPKSTDATIAKALNKKRNHITHVRAAIKRLLEKHQHDPWVRLEMLHCDLILLLRRFDIAEDLEQSHRSRAAAYGDELVRLLLTSKQRAALPTLRNGLVNVHRRHRKRMHYYFKAIRHRLWRWFFAAGPRPDNTSSLTEQRVWERLLELILT